MSDQEKIIYTVQVNEGDAEKRIITLRATIAQLTRAIRDLERANKAQSITTEQYASQFSILDRALRANKAELRDRLKTQEQLARADKANVQSTNQTNTSLLNLKRQIADLVKTEQSLTDTNPLGQHVGNVADELKKMEGSVADNKKTVSSYLTTLDNSFGVFGGRLASVQEGIGNFKTGLEATKVGLTGLKGAIAATGIGLLVLALGALYTWLQKSQAGLDFVEKKTAAVGKVIDVVTGTVLKIGRTLYKAFTEGGPALDTLIKKSKDLFVTLVQVSTLQPAGFIKLFGYVKEGGKQLADAAQSGNDLADALIQVRRGESDLNVKRTESRARIAELKKIAEDTSKSQQQRSAAIREAYQLENKLLTDGQSLQKRKIDLMVKEAEQGRKLRGEAKITEAEQKTINEERAAYFELAEQSLEKLTEQNNQINQLEQEAISTAKARREAAQQAALEQLQIAQQIAEKRVEIARLRGQDTLALEVKAIEAAAAVELAQAGKSAKLKAAIVAEREAKIYAVVLEFTAKQAALESDTQRAILETRLAQTRAGSSTELRLRLALINTNAEAEKAQIKKDADNSEAGRRNLVAKLAEIDAKARAEAEQLSQGFYDREVQRLQEAADKQAEIRAKLNTRIADDQGKSLVAQQADIERGLSLVAAGSKDELKLRIALINNRRQQELNNAKVTAEERKQINAKADKEIADAQKLEAIRKVAETLTAMQQITDLFSTVIEAQLAEQSRQLDKQQAAALSAAGLSADQRLGIEKEYQQKRLNLEREGARKRKQLAIVQNIINTALAVTNALATADQFTKVLQVALALATGAAQQAVIERQQFARGGVFRSDGRGAIVRGPGTSTSDSINARLSDRETVINAESSRRWKPLLSLINQDGGGRSFDSEANKAPFRPMLAMFKGLPIGAGLYQSPVANLSPAVLNPGYAAGGIAQGGGGIDYDLLAQKIGQQVGAANLSLPVPVLPVEEVTRLQRQVAMREAQNDL